MNPQQIEFHNLQAAQGRIDQLKAEREEANDRAFRASEAHAVTMQKLKDAEAERDMMRGQAEYYRKRCDELQKKLSTAPFADQFRHLSHEYARLLSRLENIRNERDKLQAKLDGREGDE